MIGAAEMAHDGFLLETFVMIEHMDVKPALRADHRGKQPDRTRTGHKQRLRRPGARAVADALGVVPGLGDDTGRFDQNALHAERWIELDQEFRLDAKKIRAITVALLDAALGIAAV